MSHDDQRRSRATSDDGDTLDPMLSRLFAATSTARSETTAESFVAGVMQRADRQRRRALVGRALCGLVLAILAVPLQDPLELATEYLLAPLIDVESPLGQLLFSPLSSVGALLSLALVALQSLYKRLFR